MKSFVFFTLLLGIRCMANDMIDPLRLFCTLSEDRLSSEIKFKEKPDRKIIGEIKDYTINENGKKKLISKSTLNEVKSDANSVSGLIGESTGYQVEFTFTHADTSLSGFWDFEFVDQNGQRVSARFKCKYRNKK